MGCHVLLKPRFGQEMRLNTNRCIYFSFSTSNLVLPPHRKTTSSRGSNVSMACDRFRELGASLSSSVAALPARPA
jgi:hypothetical protein